MEKSQIAVLKLLRSGLLDEPCDDIDGRNLDWNLVWVIAFRQGITNIVYSAIKKNEIDVPSDYIRLFQIEALKGIRRDHLQQECLKTIYNEFEKNEVFFLPLKGCILKSVFPKPEFRWMSDLDIYIEKWQYEKISPIMERLGFSYFIETNHELKWIKGKEIEIELHTLIMDPDYGMVSFFEEIVEKAKKRSSGYHLSLNMNEHLLYAVAHFAKHYVRGYGVNIRNLLDICFLRKKSDIDLDYLEKNLKELSLDKFFSFLCDTIDQWFGSMNFSKESDQFLSKLLDVSKTSLDERFFTSNRIKEQKGYKHSVNSTFSYLIKVFFVPYKTMIGVYPILRNIPVLLPLCWIWRPIDRLFSDPKHLKNFLKNSLSRGGVNEDKYINEIKWLGLENVLIEPNNENE